MYLDENDIDSVGVKILAKVLETNQTLEKLFLYGNSLGDEGIQALAEALQTNQSLQYLDLRFTEIGPLGIQSLAGMLKCNQGLQELELSGNRMGSSEVILLMKTLETNRSLRILTLGEDDSIEIEAKALAKLLTKNQYLVQLNFVPKFRNDDKGIIALAKTLEENLSFENLFLQANQIRDKGAQLFGEVLTKNQGLKNLNLSNNKISDVGAQALALGLEINQTLQELYLSRNQIGEEGIKVLASVLEQNYTLQYLIFSADEGEFEPNVRIKTLLEVNRQTVSTFEKQIREAQNFLSSYQASTDPKYFLQLQNFLQAWSQKSKDIIPCIEEINRQSGRPELSERHRSKLQWILTDLSDRLYNLCLDPFEHKLMELSHQYVMGKTSVEKGNSELIHDLYETWMQFFGFECPDWLEEKEERLMPFGNLLSIAVGNTKENATDLQEPASLFKRIIQLEEDTKKVQDLHKQIFNTTIQ